MKSVYSLLIVFLFIDILILPNFKYFVIPLSLPLVAWVLFTKKIKIRTDKEFLVIVILSLLILISTVLSWLWNNDFAIWIDNIKRAFQLITSFGYYFIIRDYLEIKSVNIKKILLIFLGAYTILGIISIIDLGTYFSIKSFLGVRDGIMNQVYLEYESILFRYSYILVDPNNSAYFLLLVAFYLLTNEKLNILESFFVYLVVLFALILSMSTGALLSSLIFSVFYIILKVKGFFTSRIPIKKIMFMILTPFLILLFIYVFKFINDNFLYAYTDYSTDRMFGNTDGGRLSKYGIMFSERLPNFIGEGYTLIRDTFIFRPHSDHLRFLYSYGIIAYLLSIWFFFRNIIFSSRFLFIIPAFFAYSINSLIDEQKLLVIFLMLLAFVKSHHMNFKK